MRREKGKKIQVTVDKDTYEILKQVAGTSDSDKVRGIVQAYLNEKSFTKEARKKGTIVPSEPTNAAKKYKDSIDVKE